VVAYANIKKTVADNLDCSSSARITRKSYQSFAQNLVEISFIPRINKRYLEKYIHIENKDYAAQAFNRGKGVIFLIVHEGNWELSNIICANLDLPFVLFVRDQGFPRLNALLNYYRLKQGAKIIHKNTGVRQLIEVLKSNQSIGMTTDQGGRKGQLVNFFGKEASMSTGAIKLALKYDCAIIPIFYTRIKGPYTKVILDQVFTVTTSSNPQNDLHQNLQRLISIYEKYLRQYPYEYLWTYKIFKYGKEKEIMILSDGKTGHLRQSESVAKLIIQQLASRGIKATLNIREVKFRSSIFRRFFNLSIILSGKYSSDGCLFWLRNALTDESWQGLMGARPDIIISAGGKLSAINYLLSKENQSKSIVLMRSVLSDLKKFDLKIIPRHDLRCNSNTKKNIVITEGALNLVDWDYLNETSERLTNSALIKGALASLTIGVLIGGSSKNFSISRETITQVIIQLKKAAEGLDADILFSTSRRTENKVELAVKSQLTNYSRCKLLVIANENNHPDAVGGILSLSNIIISSPESISMISEAVSAEKYVVVFNSGNLSAKHQRFLKNYQDKKYIYLEEIKDLSSRISQLLQNKPQVNSPKDNLKVIEGLNKIL
jgi:KDO2-lipid IV(A) lauroyltransferase